MSKEQLLEVFPELTELDDGSDGLSRFLTHDMFQDSKNLNENSIDTQSLMLFGLLHCKSTRDEMAKLYCEMTKKQLSLDENQEIGKNDIS